jgi:hypothetical protein
MAAENWFEIYRDLYTAEERAEEVTRLKAEARTNNRAQGRGDASYEKDLAMLQSKLQALARLGAVASGSAKERGDWGVADFSSL